MSYPVEPGYKTGGASQKAAVAIKGKAPTIAAQVLAHIQENGPSTPTQISQEIGRSFLSVRPRCSELYKRGKIKKTEWTKESPHGGTEHYYALASSSRSAATSFSVDPALPETP